MLEARSTAIIRKLALLCFAGLLLSCSMPAERAWSYSSDAPSRTGLLPLEDGVVLGNEAGALLRLDDEGRELWRLELVRELVARPTVVGTTVVAATTAGEWVGAELATGRELWRVGGRPVVTSPLVSDAERAFAIAQDGSVQAISVGSGGTIWKRLPPRGLPGGHLPQGAIAMLEGALIVSLGPAGVWALDPADGATLWQRPLGEVVGVLAEGERVYAVTGEGQLTALRASDGGVEWTRRLEAEVTAGPWLARGLLWVAVGPSSLLAADSQDGSEVWRLALPGPVRGGLGEYRELVLVPTDTREGRLLGFRPGQARPVLELRADSALRTSPVVSADQVRVVAADGRVLCWRITRTSL
jgi:outer membrane protein assembly factor BamB